VKDIRVKQARIPTGLWSGSHPDGASGSHVRAHSGSNNILGSDDPGRRAVRYALGVAATGVADAI
jgi:hypothetical protein